MSMALDKTPQRDAEYTNVTMVTKRQGLQRGIDSRCDPKKHEKSVMSRSGITILSIAMICLTALGASALGPHEVVLLVNTNSQRSVDIAVAYARLRNVPEINIVRLGLSTNQSAQSIAMSREEFTRDIWLPANAAVKDRGIGDHILAWVYSVDFPVKITTDPQVSITGLTFTRNKLPDKKLVSRGLWRSPLFGGPMNPDARTSPSQSFDVARGLLGEDMPLPCMLLGYAGVRGNSKEVVLKCIENGVASDRTRPAGMVYFLTSDDVRSRARDWQFQAAQKRLSVMGVSSVITNNVTPGRTNILGVMAGVADLDPRRFGTFLPGSIADHLTSCAADFANAAQTKLSAWIDAGASVSAGTVTEPFAMWTKFPCAWTYVHYASGCTAIESLSQGVSCPMQILLVGEPLACPWAPDASLIITGLEARVVSGMVRAVAEVKSHASRSFVRYMFLMDGRVVPGAPGVKATQAGSGNSIDLETSSLSDGSHTLRAVAYTSGSVRGQVFAEKTFVVKNRK